MIMYIQYLPSVCKVHIIVGNIIHNLLVIVIKFLSQIDLPQDSHVWFSQDRIQIIHVGAIHPGWVAHQEAVAVFISVPIGVPSAIFMTANVKVQG